MIKNSIFLIFIFYTLAFYLNYHFCKFINNFDEPTPDKIHKIKTVNSGGFFSIIFFITILANYKSEFSGIYIPNFFTLILSLYIITFLSFFDDIKSLPYQFRLIIQFVLVFLSLSSIPISNNLGFQTPLFLGNIPLKVDVILSILFWIFIINGTNFIDGIDGILGSLIITNSIFFGFILFDITTENFFILLNISFFLLGFIFLFFNIFNKFKMFGGDSLSIPVGFFIGWYTLLVSSYGYLLSAILINFVFFLDIFLTLIIRIIKRKSIFVRHNDFFFKKISIKIGVLKTNLIILFFNIFFGLLSVYIYLNKILIIK